MPTSNKAYRGGTCSGGRRRRVLAAPWFVPAAALGRDGKAAASERITLGVIGIGPRCTYDLEGMLSSPTCSAWPSATCRPAAARPARSWSTSTTATRTAPLYRDFRELLGRSDIDAVLIATGDRWHAPASILAAAGRQGRLQRKALRPDHRRLPGPGRHRCRATKRVFQAGTQRRSVANFQAAVQLAHSGKLGKLHTLYASVYTPRCSTTPGCRPSRRRRATWWTGTSGWGRRRGGRTTRPTCQGGGAATGTSTPAPGCSTGAPTPSISASGPTRPTTPCRSSTSRRPTNITARYANGVKLVLDFLKTPFGERPGWVQSLGTCPVRFVGDEGWVETGDSGGIEVQPDVAAGAS